MQSGSVCVIIPAAGASTRFGSADKLRQPWGNGTVLETVVQKAAELAPLEILVICAPGAGPVAGGRVVFNPAPERGMAGSISTGVRAADDDAQGFLIWPGDMPTISTQAALAVIAAGDVGSVVRPEFAGLPGHPVLFGASYRNALEAHQEGSGAKKILKDLMVLATTDASVIQDIDTRIDYEALRTKHLSS
ncbi:MAG: molybdenum cofactor cytidylyltransferase [Thalassolituus oleivorans]|jgi:molybdenum cofactor cytidylyltransferase